MIQYDMMNFDFPQVDLPTEIVAWPDVTEEILNLYKQSCRLKTGIFALCMEGSMKASINLYDYEIKPNDLVTLLPGTIIQFHERTERVKLSFIGFSSKCLERINLVQKLYNTYPKIVQTPVISLQTEFTDYFNDFFTLISRMTFNESFETSTELIEATLSFLISGVNIVYQNYIPNPCRITRKEELCKELVQYIIQHYTSERKAQFYAEKLGVSQQHLSTTVKQVTGKNVLDLIAYVVIMDAKAKLKSSNMTIQEIAYSLNFPNASFFGKYFKRYVGSSPAEYRYT